MKFRLKDTVSTIEARDDAFRRRMDNIDYPSWLLMPTNEGARFLIATALLALASFNTGNNMIYLIFALMLSIITLAYTLVTINLKGLAMNVSTQGPVYANAPGTLSIRVHNAKAIASYSLRIRLPEGFEGEGLVPIVGGSKSELINIPVTVGKRGRYGYGSFYVESGFPFIFFRRRIKVPVKGELLVYPEIAHVSVGRLAGMHGEGRARFRPGQGDELHSIRTYTYGDDLKSVHWKASARAGEILVREFAEHEAKVATIILDNFGSRGEDDFERSVSNAASLAHDLVRNGYRAGLLTCRGVIEPASGHEHLFAIMDMLATVEQVLSCSMPTDTARLGALVLVMGQQGSPFSVFAEEAAMRVYADFL